jgi:hypothetical protein
MIVLAVLMVPTAVLAKGECREERKKFCAGLQKKELWACLRKHEAEVAAPCKTKLEARAMAKEGRAGHPSAPDQSSPSTDTQPQPTYPDGKPE